MEYKQATRLECGYEQKDCHFDNQHHKSLVQVKNGEGSLIFACQRQLEHKNIWYLDSICSNHIMEDWEAFLNMDSSFVSKVKLRKECVEVGGKDKNGFTTKKEAGDSRYVLGTQKLWEKRDWKELRKTPKLNYSLLAV